MEAAIQINTLSKTFANSRKALQQIDPALHLGKWWR